jgi:hypothetical protein
MRLGAFVRGIGVRGPGLSGWQQAAPLLRAPNAYRSAATELPAPLLLPPAERRRCGRLVRLVLAVATEAAEAAGLEPAGLPSVFASSGGDGENCHELCESLAAEVPEVSPTRFTNSVQNAPAGYWSIAVRAHPAASVVSAFDASFGAGLIEALARATVEDTPLLLVAYDCDYPEPLRAKRPVPDAFGVALVLEPMRSSASRAFIEVEYTEAGAASIPHPALEGLRASIPAARALPLLIALAHGGRAREVLEYLEPLNLGIRIEPCG